MKISRLVLAALLGTFLPLSAQGQAGEGLRFLQTRSRPPADYVLSKLADHRAVLLGEAHRIRHDVQLVIDLIPRLRGSGADALALEILPAASQPAIDRIVTAETWDSAAATEVLRTAAWPYREYLDILHAAWQWNRGKAPEERLRLLALGPGLDWRERLPPGDDYESFMARIVLEFLKPPGRRVLVYSGLHHAFTRYHQPELPRDRKVERFMDRAGNILWRELGEDVFLIVLEAPWQCRGEEGEKWARCLPVGGAIDCAASALGRSAGFDIAGSPFAELRIGPDFLYGLGYPSLRLVDFADGFVWTRPIEEYQTVSLLTLSDFAPDEESLRQVAQNHPFSDEKNLDRAASQALWDEELERLRNAQSSFGWNRLSGWRKACPPEEPKPAAPPKGWEGPRTTRGGPQAALPHGVFSN